MGIIQGILEQEGCELRVRDTHDARSAASLRVAAGPALTGLYGRPVVVDDHREEQGPLRIIGSDSGRAFEYDKGDWREIKREKEKAVPDNHGMTYFEATNVGSPGD